MHPRQRTEGLVVSRVGGDLVVFDEQTSHLHTIPDPIAAVWRACDGTVDHLAIGKETALTPEQVDAAVLELHRAGLLASDPAQVQTSRTRRALVKQASLGAAIVSVTVPMAAQANSEDQIVCAGPAVLTDYERCMGTGGTYNCADAGCPAGTVYIYNYYSILRNAQGTLKGYRYNHRCMNGNADFTTTTPWLPEETAGLPACTS